AVLGAAARRERAALRRVRALPGGRGNDRLLAPPPVRGTAKGRAPRRALLRLPRGRRLVPARAARRLPSVLPAVVARVSPRLREHGAVQPAAAAAARPARRRRPAERGGAALEPGPHLPRGAQPRPPDEGARDAGR